jgi:RNA polymerase sigma-70 factor, ECF subfamily
MAETRSGGVENVMNWNPLAATISESLAAAPDPDAMLMLRFRDGDVAAFEELFRRHMKPLLNFVNRFVRNRPAAEELTQEIFLRVHDASGSYRAEAKFTTWLYRIATNVCLNEVRRPRFRARHESLDETDPEDPGTVRFELADTRALADRSLQQRAVAVAMKRALETLPEKQRAAFILCKYQELSYAEVAQVMDTTEKAVKSLIHRAKEALAEALKPLLPELMP